jgi:hypothetical protein
MLKLGLILVVPYLAVASVATGAVDGTDTFDAIQNFVSEVSQQSDEVATAIVNGPSTLDHKITVCHLPNQDLEKAHLMSISLDALPEHEAHGDYKLTAPELLTDPLMSVCADDTDVVSEEQSGEGSDKGKAPEHSNAGGGRDGQGRGGPSEHPNAGANGQPGND